MISQKIASAFLTESKLDLKSAKLLFENGIYSRAIYFAHQSSEKAIKSCLAIRNITSGEHKVTVFFEKEFSNDFDKKVFSEILKKADFILNSLMEFVVSNLGNYPEK